MLEKQIILLFIKAPVEGTVKSRLAIDLGDHTAVELYKNFILDTVDTAVNSGYPFRMCVDPPDGEKAVSDLFHAQYRTMPQDGHDLGGKMGNAFRRIFSEGFTSAILIGSDIPDLASAVFQEAIESLKKNDVVIGPSADGGYYLIGFNRDSFLPNIFHGITWSTNTVFRETMNILNKASLRVHRAPLWKDVDTLDDLKGLFDRNRNTVFNKSRTMTYLMNKQLLGRIENKI